MTEKIRALGNSTELRLEMKICDYYRTKGIKKSQIGSERTYLFSRENSKVNSQRRITKYRGNLKTEPFSAKKTPGALPTKKISEQRQCIALDLSCQGEQRNKTTCLRQGNPTSEQMCVSAESKL